MAAALWVKTIQHHRTGRQVTVPCERGDAHAALLVCGAAQISLSDTSATMEEFMGTE